MALFGKTKTEETKKDEAKPAAVKAVKKAKPEAKKSMKELYGDKAEAKASVPAAKEADAKTEAKPESKKSQSVSNAYRVLLRPLVTEKGSHLGIENKYLFEVGYDTNKIEVAKAIEITYGVKPTKVNIMKFEGKVVRRGRNAGRRKRWKKAIVTLPKGKTIQIYEGI
jgi:large subunit ribosomal protein L23